MIAPTVRSVLSWLLGLVALSGCGGSEGPSPPSPGTIASAATTGATAAPPRRFEVIAANDFCKSVFGVFVERRTQGCASDPGPLANKTREQSALDLCLKNVEVVAEGRVIVDDAAAARCLAVAVDISKKGGDVLDLWGSEACQVLVGTQAAGEPCDAQAECREGLYCGGLTGGKMSGAPPRGRCEKPTAVGHACEGINMATGEKDAWFAVDHPECEAGFCGMNGPGEHDRACTPKGTCLWASDCDGVSTCVSGACVKLGKVGDACGGDAPPCRWHCDETSKRCVSGGWLPAGTPLCDTTQPSFACKGVCVDNSCRDFCGSG